MAAWFYRLTDGLLTGDFYAGTDPDLNTPPGCAWITGVTNWRAQRVDLATGTLVDWQPPAPAGDQFTAWAWDDAAGAWVAQPTAAGLARAVRADRDARLAACDWVTLRALELGQPVPPEWAAYRAALRAVPAQPGFPASVTWPTSP